MTVLKSPEFLVEELPIECYSFCFYFGVLVKEMFRSDMSFFHYLGKLNNKNIALEFCIIFDIS
jgi:hypothetical protein